MWNSGTAACSSAQETFTIYTDVNNGSEILAIFSAAAAAPELTQLCCDANNEPNFSLAGFDPVDAGC